MSRATSPSVNRPYGVGRVCQEWGLRRSTFYHQQGRAARPPGEPAKRGPKTVYTDEALTGHIRQVLAASPFLGEGHRKVWARLRIQGIRTSKPRVLRLMRQAGLLAPNRAQRVLGPQTHDGTIITERPKSDVGHRCHQHRDPGGWLRHRLRGRRSLHARRRRASCGDTGDAL